MLKFRWHSESYTSIPLLMRSTYFIYFRNVLLLFLLSTIAPVVANAENTPSLFNNLNAGIKSQYGYVYPHSKSIRYIVEENIYAFEITLTTNTCGRTLYDSLYRYPRSGIGYIYSSLGNDRIFGKANAIFAFMQIPFNRKERKLSFYYEIDFGLAYLTKSFDPDENPMNIAISTRLNIYVGLDFAVRYVLNNRNSLTAGIDMSHYSNGKLGTPNRGINTVVVSGSYVYVIKPSRYPRGLYTTPTDTKNHRFELVASGGAKSDDQMSEKYFPVYTLVFDYIYTPRYKYSMGAGADMFYDASLGPNKTDNEGKPYETRDLYQSGIHGALYANYNKLTVLGNVGFYTYATYTKYSRMYYRIGFRYQLYKGLLLNFTLKSHYAIADFFEVGIGYRL